MQVQAIGSTLMLVVVALFLAAGLDPAVRFFERHGMRRSYAVLTVILAFLAALTLFIVAIVPVIADQVRSLTENGPQWLDQLERNRQVQRLDDKYDIISKIQEYVTNGDFAGAVFGGALGIGLAVLGALFNGFIIVVLTLYFLASLETTKNALSGSPRPRAATGSPGSATAWCAASAATSPARSSSRCAPGSRRWSSCSAWASGSTPSRWPSSSPCST